MKLELKEYNHDYYCSDSNYYSNEASQNYDNWSDFYLEYGDADLDMNLVFRWDIHKQNDDHYWMEIFMIQQRKGIFIPISICYIKENDLKEIEIYLKKNKDKLNKLWNPLG